MRRRKNKKQAVLEQTGDAAIVALELLHASSAAFAPLQSATGGALHIAKLVHNFRSDTKNWTDFGDYVQNQVKYAIENIPDQNSMRADIKESIQQLSSTLERIATEIGEIQAKSTISRFIASSKNPGKLVEMKQHLDEAIRLLMLRTALTTGRDVAAIAEQKNNQDMAVQLLERCMQLIETTITATALPYTPSAGWDDMQVCLVGTRRAQIDDVMAWVSAKNLHGTQQIYFVTDVVGSGKTALAHSIAEQCSYAGVLASSFFFDQNFGRTSARHFVFNLVRDLDRIPAISPHISSALRADPNLALSQPVARVFQKLVSEPLVASNTEGPFVVVIDALNQTVTAEVQDILRTQIPKLPGIIRIFVTSRPERSILRSLGPDIVNHDLAIHQAENYQDIRSFIDYKLAEIASHHSLQNWPDLQLTAKLLERAEGLFLWVVIICDYLLSYATYPDKMLERLLDSMRNSPLPPEEKMDHLYSTILDTCHWDDPDFVDGYEQVMGVMVAQQIALPMDALQELHGRFIRVRAILDPLASLITGVNIIDQPVQLLHNSFREYITLRATDPRSVDLNTHNLRLTLLCLRILNDALATRIGGCGYLKITNGAGIPEVEVDHFTEQQWYAAKFWPSHLTQVTGSSPEVLRVLRTFLEKHLIKWLEVLISKCTYQSLVPVLKWLQANADTSIVTLIANEHVLKCMRRLPMCLIEDLRQGEALQVIADLKQIEEDFEQKSDDSELLPVSSSSD